MSSTSLETRQSSVSVMADFVTACTPPASARGRAAMAVCDTVGVILAGAVEPAARMIRAVAGGESTGRCSILGTAERASAGEAALANGVAAHALDYDDMCFVSMAHPSCALVPAILAAGELAEASGRLLLDAYIAGFEIECRLGLVMNPRHYHVRGWHCTSSIGTVGAAAAAARMLGLSASQVVHALGIAASTACGMKENLGTMVKPLHAGVAARNGVMAARLAQKGFTASEHAFDGPQGYLAVMDSERSPAALAEATADLGSRWEILDTGISVKLYPSCAATHPPLDAVLRLVSHHSSGQHKIEADDVISIDVEVDSMTPRLLIYDRPTTGLEGKFSMPFCVAVAVIHGHPTIDTFDVAHTQDRKVQDLGSRVTMRVNPEFDKAAPLSQARATIRLRDGRTLVEYSDGARGYPGRLSKEELATKFLGCAQRSLTDAAAEKALDAVMRLDAMKNVSELAGLCTTDKP